MKKLGIFLFTSETLTLAKDFQIYPTYLFCFKLLFIHLYTPKSDIAIQHIYKVVFSGQGINKKSPQIIEDLHILKK